METNLIRVKRKLLGINQTEFANILGYSRPIVSRAENDYLSVSFNALLKMCDYLDIGLGELKLTKKEKNIANCDNER